MSYSPNFIQVPEVRVVCNWPTEDVTLFGYDTDGRLVCASLSAAEARTLAEQLLTAVKKAQEFDERFEKAQREMQEARVVHMGRPIEAGRNYPLSAVLNDIEAGQLEAKAGVERRDALLSDPTLFNEFSGMSSRTE